MAGQNLMPTAQHLTSCHSIHGQYLFKVFKLLSVRLCAYVCVGLLVIFFIFSQWQASICRDWPITSFPIIWWMSESSDCHLIDGLVCVCDLSATEDILGFLLFFKLAVFIRWPLLTGENQNQIKTIWRFRLGFFWISWIRCFDSSSIIWLLNF